MSYALLPPVRRAALGSAASTLDPVLQSMGPYAPFTSATLASGAVAMTGATGPEAQLATELLSDAIQGNHVDIPGVATQAGAIAGGVAGAYAGPLGAVVGSIVGGMIGKAIGGLFGGSDDCDPNCYANKVIDQISSSLCVHRDTGQIDPACRAAAWQLATAKYTCMGDVIAMQASRWSGKKDAPLSDRCQAILGPWRQPWTPEGNEIAFRAALGREAAKIRLADDVAWAKKVIVLANTTADQWGPKCASGDSPCVDEVKANAIQYAFNAHPFRQENAAAAEGPAYQQLQYAMDHAIGESKARVQGLQAGIDAKKAASAASAQAVSDKISGASAHRKIFLAGAGVLAAAAIAFVLLDD